MGEILVITIKRGWERGAIGASNLAYLPQYDRFMGIGDGKGELLEMLLYPLILYHSKSCSVVAWLTGASRSHGSLTRTHGWWCS
jgi:hypothetical protein